MSLFDFIKEKLSLLDVIGHSIQLRQMGSYWKGPCPFHAEKDASFTVSPERQIFYCFGCQASGDVIGFVARLENMSQMEAANYLVERYQLPVPPHIKTTVAQGAQEKDAKNRYFQLCKAVAQWAHNTLLHDANALKYVRERSINDATIKTFCLGYFPSGSVAINSMLKTLAKDGFLLDDLRTYSIVMEGKGTLFSPFEERILFPIKDTLGRFCGFGGRVFKSGDERPKYYNSKEADGFEKGKLLFGYDLAKKPMMEAEKAFLVEGYIDCVMMAQHGHLNTIATLGTACTVNHLKILARSIETLYVLYDGDAAGMKAMLRLAEMCWEVNLDLKVVVLPNGHDPASFLASGNPLQPLLDSAQDIITFYIATTGSGFSNKSLAQKMIAAEKIASVIVRIKNQFKQDILLHHAANTMQIPFESLKGLMMQHQNNRSFTPEEPSEEEGRQEHSGEEQKVEPEIITLEEKIFSAILRSMAIKALVRVPDEMHACFSASMQKILEKLTHYEQQKDTEISLGNFINTLTTEEQAWADRIQFMHDGALQLPMIEALLARLYRHHWQNSVNELKHQLAQAKQSQNLAEVQTLLERFARMKETIVTWGLIR